MHRTLSRARSRQRGQGTTEFIVVLFAAVPMLLLFPLVGKYIDLIATTEQASRYVAFESTVHIPGTPQAKSDATLQSEVARRFFSGERTTIVTGEGPQDIGAAHSNVWVDHRGTRFLQDLNNDVAVNTELKDFETLPLAQLVVNDMKLPENRLNVATVTVRPHALPNVIPFDTMNLSISRRTAVLADAWTGTDHRSAKRVVENMSVFYPTNIEGFAQLQDIFGQLAPMLGDDPIPNGMPDSAWDLLPCDRIKGC
jgi:hypothetical protein